jgi:hypothetical protein
VSARCNYIPQSTILEVWPTGCGLHDEVVAHHHICLAVVPPMVPTASGRRVKANRLDSCNLAMSLRGELDSIHLPSQNYHELRHLVQLPDSDVKH